MKWQVDKMTHYRFEINLKSTKVLIMRLIIEIIFVPIDFYTSIVTTGWSKCQVRLVW